MTFDRTEDNLKSSTRRHRTTLLATLALLGSLVFAAAALASARPGSAPDPEATASVIGGHDAKISEYPSLAFIEGVQATAGYACTGTVVAPRVILTAGHCVEDIESSSIVEPKLIAVATGVSNLRKIQPARISQVERVLAYPGFDPTQLHGDAGLLILTAPVSAPPIALATGADAALYEPGDQLTVAGWGIDNRSTGHAPNQLQAATVPIEEASRCKEGTRRFYPFFDPSRQICALDSPHFKITTCHGDSGGPAIATRADGTPIEVGVTSLGDGSCNPSSPAVFTRVDQISSWVESWIAAVEAGAPAPPVKVPKAHIPLLTRERAEEISGLAMEEAFGSAFVHGQEKTIKCRRQAKARLRCGVTWFQGPNDYFGKITVFFAIRHNVVLAGVHYTLHWVNDQCYFHSGNPAACPVETKKK
ncbi:MAG TPA: serine protease [Solirubrobacterales bacterium]|nr:serine protease [Solirubrobacterales bacterium]